MDNWTMDNIALLRSDHADCSVRLGLQMIKAINTVKELYPEADLAMRIGEILVIIALVIYVLCWCGVCLFVTFRHYPFVSTGLAVTIGENLVMIGDNWW